MSNFIPLLTELLEEGRKSLLLHSPTECSFDEMDTKCAMHA